MNEAYLNAVEILISNGYKVIQISFETFNVFYLVHSFQESVLSGPSPVDYNTLVGINITEFMKNMTMVQDKSIFMNNFQNRINSSFVTRIQFSRNQEWICWSPS